MIAQGRRHHKLAGAELRDSLQVATAMIRSLKDEVATKKSLLAVSHAHLVALAGKVGRHS